MSLDFVTSEFLMFVAIGFFAQVIDGALGMAFGVLTTTSLLAIGVAPAAASAMTHVTECFTTAASGASHVYNRNVDWRLVARLAPAGMVGGAIGAYVLSNIDGKAIEPFVSAYLIAVGLFILYKAFRPKFPRDVRDWIVPYVGGAGGLLDAMGGGGWGADRHELAARPRSRPEKGDRLHQPHRIRGHHHDLGDLHRRARLVGTLLRPRPHPRRHPGSPDRRLHRQAPAGQTPDDRRVDGHHRHRRGPAGLRGDIMA